MKVRPNASVSFNVVVTLNESEARALEALAGYGTQSFLKTFYDELGSHYLKPYESGIVSLFESIKERIKPALSKIDKARDAINEPIDKLIPKNVETKCE